jgi:cytochrome c biogenesis protein CcmG/thiol:disulfide interchange protein DsbE
MRFRLEWIAVLALVALMGVGWIALSRDDAPGTIAVPAAQAPFVGNLAPDFTLQTVDGTSVTLADYAKEAGTPVVLNFWATWCPPCRVEMPFFERASRTYDGQVAILGVNQAEKVETIAEYARKNGLTYPLLADTEMKVNNLYAVLNLPTTLFIDRNGVVQEILIGTISQAVLEDRIEELLNE